MGGTVKKASVLKFLDCISFESTKISGWHISLLLAVDGRDICASRMNSLLGSWRGSVELRGNFGLIVGLQGSSTLICVGLEISVVLPETWMGGLK